MFSVVERDGRARSFHVANVTGAELHGAIQRNVDPEAPVVTDAWAAYKHVWGTHPRHETVSPPPLSRRRPSRRPHPDANPLLSLSSYGSVEQAVQPSPGV